MKPLLAAAALNAASLVMAVFIAASKPEDVMIMGASWLIGYCSGLSMGICLIEAVIFNRD